MISVNIPLEQLLDIIRHLPKKDKARISEVLNEDITLSEEMKQEILHRDKAYEAGTMKTYSLEEVINHFGVKEG